MGSIVQGSSCWLYSPVYTPVGLLLPLNLPSPADATLCLGILNTVFLTPRHRYLSQGCTTISVPLFSHPIQLHPVFKTPECSSTTDGVTQIIAHVFIVYREAEPLHNTVLIDLKSIGQLEIGIRFYNVFGDTN